MNQLKPLFWKEWLEIRGFFLIALFVFLGLPLLGGIEARYTNGRFEIMASVWEYFLGGVLAIFVGVGTVVRDLNGRLEDFWRSRPVSVSRWLIVKYFVGLAVVIFTLMAPLVLEVLTGGGNADLYISPQLLLAWHPFLWAVLYSVGFLMACLVRRKAHAAMLSIAVMLLLYYLPEVIPPLHHLGIAWANQESQFPRRDHDFRMLSGYHGIPWAMGKVVFRAEQLQFAIGMLVLCALAVAISLWVIRRDVRIESGRRTIYWSIGGALLVLFASASFQVATNLTVQHTVSLPEHEWIIDMQGDADHALIATQEWVPGGSTDSTPREPLYRVRPMRVTSSGIEFGEPIVLGKRFWWNYSIWQPQRPDVVYNVKFSPEGPNVDQHYPTLQTIQFGAPVAKITEQSFPDLLVKEGLYDTSMYVVGGRLNVLFGTYSLVFDISKPTEPRLVSQETINGGFLRTPPHFTNFADHLTFLLPQITGLSARQRLEMVMWRWRSFRSDTVILDQNGPLAAFHLEELTDISATFRKVGGYDPTPVQKLFGSGSYRSAMGEGLYYQAMGSTKMGTGVRIAVFDISDPQRLSPIGHIAFPNRFQADHLLPLKDGRVIASAGNPSEGNTLWLISAPPKH